jgi:hypothetical protein
MARIDLHSELYDSDAFCWYRTLNPAYGKDTMDERAMHDLDKLFFDPKTLPETMEGHEDKEVRRNIEFFIEMVRFKLAQLMDNETWEEKGGSTQEEFEKSPRTFMKTVQEILTHPTERMVFERDEKPNLQDIIIDPRKITNSLLQNLGLGEYIPKKGTPKNLQLQARAQAIPEIREMLSGLEPIELPGESRMDYFRMMRITKGRNTGFVIGTQGSRGEKLLYKTDLFGAERRLEHIGSGYSGEIAKLKEIEHHLKIVQERLRDWNELKDTGELQELRDRMLVCAEGLKFVQDADKKALKEKIGRCVELKDGQGRDNPTITRSVIGSTFKFLGARLRRIERISGHLGQDGTKIEQLMHEQSLPLDDFVEGVERLHGQFSILKDEEMSDDQKAEMIRNLRRRISDAGQLQFEPMRTFGKKFMRHALSVIEALQGEGGDAKEEFVKMYLVTKLSRAYGEIQELYRRISLDGVGIDFVREEAQKIQEKLDAQEVAPDLQVEGFGKPFGQLYYLLKAVSEAKTPAQAKKKIKDFDFVQFIRMV